MADIEIVNIPIHAATVRAAAILRANCTAEQWANYGAWDAIFAFGEITGWPYFIHPHSIECQEGQLWAPCIYARDVPRPESLLAMKLSR